MSEQHYVGGELEMFADAYHWKGYFSDRIKSHLGSNVLEVGAGLGGTTAILSQGFRGQWCCLEPDPKLANTIRNAVTAGALPATCTVSIGTLASLPESVRFDSILYIDVLEHIEGDAAEASLAASRLSAGGKLIVLAPAYQWLYCPFDRAIGHFRRYSKRTLLKAIPAALDLVECSYLDSVGLLASAGNRFVTRASLPSKTQVRIWDGLMVPLSKLVDPLVGHAFGKSLLGVWQKPNA